MILYLCSIGTVIINVVEFCLLCVTEGNIVSIPLFLVTLLFFLVCYISWKSTDTPSNIPPPPTPPFVISIQTIVPGTGQRFTLQDIRLFSTQPYLSRLLNEIHISTDRNTRSSDTGNINTNLPSTLITSTTAQAPTSPSSVFRRFWFRQREQTLGPTRPFRSFFRSRLHPPVLFSYHRFFPRNRNTVVGSVHRELLGNTPDVTRQFQGNNNPNFVESDTALTRPLESAHQSSSDTNLNLSSVAREVEDVVQVQEVNQEVSASSRRFNDSNIPEVSILSQAGINRTGGNQNKEMDTTLPEGQVIKFTVKFLNDTQLEVTTSENEKIGNFKKRHFSRELNENKVVRLIFNGRVLDNENRTLKDSGIFDQCVIHCLVVTPQQHSPQSTVPNTGNDQAQGNYIRYDGGQSNNHNNSRGPEPGMFFVTLMGVILMFLWFICFNFGQQLFTQSAVVSLSVLTGIFLIGLVAFYLPVHPTPNAN